MAVDFSFDDGLFVIRLSGSLEPDDLRRIADEVVLVESRHATAPPRLTDFRDLASTNVGYVEMSELAGRSVARPLSTPVRSALLVGQPVQFGFARMFQTLNTHPLVTVQIFDDEVAARDWLAGR
jgi:Zn-dependent protease